MSCISMDEALAIGLLVVAAIAATAIDAETRQAALS
jgi:hypothetical protein